MTDEDDIYMIFAGTSTHNVLHHAFQAATVDLIEVHLQRTESEERLEGKFAIIILIRNP